MGERTVAKCVLRVCNAIIEVLTPIEMPEPTAATWLHSARLFHEMWQFPHCIAAIDGKHVQILAPKNSGSMFHNYKHTKSIVLLTLVDASYRFVVADVGAFGKNSDGGILSRSEMGQRFARNEMDIPEADLLPGSTVTAPYTMVGDEAFALSDYLLRPYPGTQARNNSSKRRFNFRLSRARRIVENGFGILTQRWRLYLRPIPLPPRSANIVVMTTLLLHNFLTPSTFELNPNHPLPAMQQISPIISRRRRRVNQLQSGIQARETIRQYLDINDSLNDSSDDISNDSEE